MAAVGPICIKHGNSVQIMHKNVRGVLEQDQVNQQMGEVQDISAVSPNHHGTGKLAQIGIRHDVGARSQI